MEERLDAVKPSIRFIVSNQAIVGNVKQSKILVYSEGINPNPTNIDNMSM